MTHEKNLLCVILFRVFVIIISWVWTSLLIFNISQTYPNNHILLFAGVLIARANLLFNFELKINLIDLNKINLNINKLIFF